MPEKYVPKHRNEPPKRVREGAKNAVLYSGVAVFATSIAVGAGLSGSDDADPGTGVNLAAGRAQLRAADLADRDQGLSRSGSDRTSAQASALKAAELDPGTGVAVPRSENLAQSDPKALTRALMAQYGLDPADFDCIDNIWSAESGWNVRADNPRSSAYGIPQALPGSKMATVGADWRTNAETQIRWGLGYIAKRYGTACSAWSFKQGHGWY